MSNCPICGSNGDEVAFLSGGKIICPRCGKYRISEVDATVLTAKLKGDKKRIANVSGWVREHQNELISSETVERLLQLPTPGISEKAFRLLKFVEKKTSFFGERISGCETARPLPEFYAAAWAANHEEFAYILNYLESQGLLVSNKITPAGFSYLERAKYSNENSQIGFCAMWFNDCIKPIWKDYIEPAISDAGYEPKRIDEHPHNNRIDDEIIAQIRRSKFVVADFTGQRGGVYFEAGFALGLGLPVIWTCREKELKRVHFDNRQYNFILWEEGNLPEFKLNLQYRIEATLGRGSWKPDTQ